MTAKEQPLRYHNLHAFWSSPCHLHSGSTKQTIVNKKVKQCWLYIFYLEIIVRKKILHITESPYEADLLLQNSQTVLFILQNCDAQASFPHLNRKLTPRLSRQRTVRRHRSVCDSQICSCHFTLGIIKSVHAVWHRNEKELQVNRCDSSDHFTPFHLTRALALD